MLGTSPANRHLILPTGVAWNSALLLAWVGPTSTWPWVLALAVALYLTALRPFRASRRAPGGGGWLRAFLRISYAWLIVAVGLACGQWWWPQVTGAARHALGSGFILSMIMGMGLRMIPAFETRQILWAPGPWVVCAVLTVGTAIRVFAQAAGLLSLLALGASLQFIAVLGFVCLLAGTILCGKRLSFQTAL
jgi:hypothetical protein